MKKGQMRFCKVVFACSGMLMLTVSVWAMKPSISTHYDPTNSWFVGEPGRVVLVTDWLDEVASTCTHRDSAADFEELMDDSRPPSVAETLPPHLAHCESWNLDHPHMWDSQRFSTALRENKFGDVVGILGDAN